MWRRGRCQLRIAHLEALPLELLVLALRGNVGVSTWVAASGVCTAWRDALRSDAALLVALAAYTGGLTRTQFAGLLGLSFADAARFPWYRCVASYVSGIYFLYGPEAVAQVLRERGGLEAWRARVAARASCVAVEPALPELAAALLTR